MSEDLCSRAKERKGKESTRPPRQARQAGICFAHDLNQFFFLFLFTFSFSSLAITLCYATLRCVAQSALPMNPLPILALP